MCVISQGEAEVIFIDVFATTGFDLQKSISIGIPMMKAMVITAINVIGIGRLMKSPPIPAAIPPIPARTAMIKYKRIFNGLSDKTAPQRRHFNRNGFTELANCKNDIAFWLQDGQIIVI